MSRAPEISGVGDGKSAAREDVSLQFQQECVEFFADVVQVLGVPRSVGQIYGLLFSSPQPLSFTDIAERLDISKGSASQGLQALRQLGAIHLAVSPEIGDRRSKIGDRGADSDPNAQLPAPISARGGFRRELYQPELGLRKLVSGVLREKVEPIVSDGGKRIKALRAKAEAIPNAAGRKYSAARVKQIETWRRQLGLLLPLLKTVLGPGRVAENEKAIGDRR